MEEKEFINHLVNETFDESYSNRIRSFSGYYYHDSKVYRLELLGKVIDFPAGWSFFPISPTAFSYELEFKKDKEFLDILSKVLDQGIEELRFHFYKNGEFELIVECAQVLKAA